MVKQDTKVRFLMDSGILSNNAEVAILSDSGVILFRGMAWEMDDDILDMDLKHILSVWTTTGSGDNGRVWIETLNAEPVFKPYLCVNYDADKCAGCDSKYKDCFKQRQKSSRGGFVHEDTGVYGEAINE